MTFTLVIKLSVELRNFLLGKNQYAMKGRVSEHQGVSLKTCEQVKGTLFTAVRNHKFKCDCKILSLVESQTTTY